jgi:hypothetical protein
MKSGNNDPILITAHVFAYRKAEKLPVQVGVTPDVMDLSEHQGRAINIEWKLVTPGYHFPKDNTGIVYTSPGSADAIVSITTTCEGPLAGRLVSAKIGKATGLAYAYTVSVVDESTGLTAVVDPTSIVPAH